MNYSDMAKLSPILRGATGGLLLFMCPGCRSAHGPTVGPGQGPRWSYNGDPDKPTFKPSLLVRWNTLSAEARARNEEFHRVHGRYMTHAELPYDEHHVCHSFITDGNIQFLGDCTHALAGQTVPIPDWDTAMEEYDND